MRHSAAISVFALLFLLCVSPPVPSLAQEGNGDKMPYPSIAFGWLDNKSEYQAGDIAIIKIKLFEDSIRVRKSAFKSDRMNFSLTVNGKKGDSSYISGVYQFLEDDPNLWNISFTTIRVGQFPVVIADDQFGIIDSSLHLTVKAGPIYPSACIVSWMDFINEFVAGTTVYLLLLLKDGFGNNILSGTNEPSGDYFTVTLSYENGSTADRPIVKHNGWNELEHFSLEFVPRTAGNLLLSIYGNNQNLNGFPIQIMVKPGPINPTNTGLEWKYRTNLFQVFSKLEMFIYQKDQFGNLVPGFCPYDARVVEKTSNLSIPVADLLFEEVAYGTQLLSFIVSEPGEFRLIIYDSINESIWNMACDFSVFTGYCHESNIFANGSGIATSVAGMMSSFSVYLEDTYHNPSPIDAGRLRVEILSENNTSNVLPVILPLHNLLEDNNATQISYGSTMLDPALPSTENQKIVGNSTAQASHFNVTYTPEKCGDYKIWVFCGNIPANDGIPYMMKVSPGLIDASLSNVHEFTPNVKRSFNNYFLVQLVDSYHNPVSSAQSKLSLRVSTVNSSNLVSWAFRGNENGSYTGQYMAKDAGAYSLCVFFENMRLSPCPFEVHVYQSEYFSEAKNDNVFVWEDESLAFDVLSNDYIAGGNYNIIEFSIPLHGSLLQYGQLFRYTPYKGFFGDDSFSYTILDANKNIASAMVSVSVLCKPPQFVSLPVGLNVIEDSVSHKFGVFPGFEIIYSDDKKNVSLAMRAQSGYVFFSPFPMPLQQTEEHLFSVSRGGRARKELIISGHVEIINSALQFIQYLSNENFSGNDIITFRTMNENGAEEAYVPVFVEPVNDPPIINAPKLISLTRMQRINGLQIFDKQRDTFEFSIMDTDIFKFSGNKSHFVVMFSMEVSDGTLSAILPVGLINAAELKIKGSCRWQPLQTFVSISNHFVFRGKGIRFRGTIAECNSAIQKMHYQSAGNDAALTVTVNDMGNYGCYPDCLEKMSTPLQNEFTVHLAKRRAVNRMEVLVLGSAIVVEIITMLLLGGMLLFFICKCVKALREERSDSSDATTSALPCEENVANSSHSSCV